jgi:hypothetical protein
MTATATAGVVFDNGYTVSSTMANVSILSNPTANNSSASFPDVSQLPAFPLNSSLDSLSSINGQSDSAQSSTDVIIEALRSKDRLFVLKLGEQMETLIAERKCVLFFFVFALLRASAICPVVGAHWIGSSE